MKAGLISRVILRLAALLWLGALTAAPAIAEVGCVREEAAHLQSSTGVSHESVSNPQEDGRSADTSAVGHCAFGHGPCTGILQSAPYARQRAPTVTDFASVTVKRLEASGRNGQDRPPKA